MVQRFRYFIEFSTSLRPEDYTSPNPVTSWRWKGKPDAIRFVWPKLWDTREEAEAHIEMLNTGTPSKARGLFANAGAIRERYGRTLTSASVQSVRVS